MQSFRYLAVLIAFVVSLATASIKPLGEFSATIENPNTLLSTVCAIDRCTASDNYNLPKTHVDVFHPTNEHAVNLPVSASALKNSHLANRGISISSQHSYSKIETTQTITSTTAMKLSITSTMSLIPLLAPLSAAVSDSTTTTSLNSANPTITSTFSTTITNSSSPSSNAFEDSAMPSNTKSTSAHTSTNKSVMTSNETSTNTSTTSNQNNITSNAATSSNSIEPYCSEACTSDPTPIVTSYDLTTVWVSAAPSTTSSVSTGSSGGLTASNTGFVQDSGQECVNSVHSVGTGLVTGLLIGFVLVAWL